MPKNFRFIQNIDPQEFSSRFSYTEDVETQEILETDKVSSGQYDKVTLGGTFDDILPLIEQLPPREQDLILMYFKLNKDQAEIAKIFNISQGAVSHRLRKALKRLQFLVALPKIITKEMEEDLTKFFYPKGLETFCRDCKTSSLGKFKKCPGCKKDASRKEILDSKGRKIPCKSIQLIYNLDVQIMMLMWETTCQSVVRDRLGLTQIKVRHKFLKNIERLEKALNMYPELEKYVIGFNLIKNNYNILREVELPKWKNRQKSFSRF